MARPRGFCAGVSYAVEILDLALQRYGAPIFVRHEIVHNRFVVEQFRARGAIFVEQIDDIPPGSLLIFSAHGVSPTVRRSAEQRQLRVIDATCPLVAKVHTEVLRYAAAGFEIIMIGHRGHVEVDGTMGHAPEQMQLVGSVADVARITVKDSSKIAVVTQTTLSVDDTRAIMQALRRRFPQIRTPRRDDICYATQNRQAAVAQLATRAALVLVIGSPESSNSRRMVEVAERAGGRAYLIENATAIRREWLTDCDTVGVSAGASAPESLVGEVVARLRELGCEHVEELAGVSERITFARPAALR